MRIPASANFLKFEKLMESLDLAEVTHVHSTGELLNESNS